MGGKGGDEGSKTAAVPPCCAAAAGVRVMDLMAGEPGIVDAASPILEMRGISKSFGPVRVLDDLSIACRPGEVHALCGENGAGKSTLIKVLGGVYAPDSGSILVEGRTLRFAHPVEARRAGIGIIHQELSLLPHRTVADNVFLGHEPARGGFLDKRRMAAAATALLARLGSSIPPITLAGDLTIAEQQMVEIAKALAVEARILVFDEPTAALDAAESARLFGVIAELRRSGTAVIYISHRMAEVFAMADRITVIKDGQLAVTAAAGALTPEAVIRAMVGRPVEQFFPPLGEASGGEILLRVEQGANGALSDIDLTLRAGEILGVAGLDGSGKGDLARAVFGAAPFTTGRITLPDGRGMPRSPREGAERGIAYLSDDRKAEGLGLGQSLRDNTALVLRGLAAALSRPWAADRGRGRIDETLRRVELRVAGFDLPVSVLSGGNQQKVVIARWLAKGARIWVVAEPTRGIDVGAKATIYRVLRDFAERGCAVLMVSSDLAEIIGLSDRILVMAGGRIVGELPPRTGEEAILAKALRHGAAPSAALH